MAPGAGLEPARPQWPGDFKCLATTSSYISVHLATTKTSITKIILLQRDVLGCDGCVTDLSLDPPPGEGVGPVHSREGPLPLIKDYFEALTLQNPKRASSPLRTISRIVGRVGTGTEGTAFVDAGGVPA